MDGALSLVITFAKTTPADGSHLNAPRRGRNRRISSGSSRTFLLHVALACLVLLTPSALGQTAEREAIGNSGPPPNGPPTEVTVTDRGTVRMHVADMPLSTVLHLLSLQGRRNIVASPNVSGSVTANLYDVTFDEALDAILTSNDAAYRTVGDFLYVYTNEELERIEAAQRPSSQSTVYWLNYISAADAKIFVTPLLDEDEEVTAPEAPAEGLKSDAEEGGGISNAAQEFILVTARASTHRRVKRVIDQIDVRPKQVLIEATILRAELKEQNAMGIDFTLVGGVDLELLGGASTGLADLTLGDLPQDRFEKFNAAATTDFRSNVPRGGLTIGIIQDNVALFLRALESVTNTTVLANPKVLALNKQRGQVIVGRRDGFLTTTVTETQAIQSVEFLETGTQLIYRPFIGSDGFIRVELHPEDSVGFVNAQGLPSEQTTEITTNVIVRDGETILIGGLFREVTSEARSQVPLLGNLPWVGALFRSNDDTTNREEVIILLTIHIVKDHAAYAAASREQYEDIERMRVGLRRGLMWYGRERLAQAQYARALETLGEGDKDKALWHLNLSLHNNSRFLPAIRLKERILGEREWDEDNSGGRVFLHQWISREKGYAIPRFDRPEPVWPLPQPPSEAVESENRVKPS